MNVLIGDIGNTITKICVIESNTLKILKTISTTIVLEEFDQLINAFMKDAYFAAKDRELYLVINSLKTIIELKPELAKEWDSYIAKLETRLENQKKGGEDHFAEEYIKKRQQKTIPDFSPRKKITTRL